MAVGQGAIVSTESYVALGRETTYGTAVTTTAQIPFISSSMKVTQEGKILEQIETSRTYSQHIRMGKVIEGELAGYVYPMLTACGYLLQNAFGGTVTAAAVAGDTSGSTAYEHEFNIGSHSATYSSLSINTRKGPASNGKVFEYRGVKVNEINFTAEIDEALKFSASLVGKNETTTSNDIASALTLGASMTPLSFVNGVVSVEDAVGSLTTTAFWHVQSVTFGIQNNLKTDSESRRIGSDVLDVAPVGIANLPLSMTIRFDTTTAYSAMKSSTEFAVQLFFEGANTITGSNVKPRLRFVYPRVQISSAGDPEIGGPDEILTSEVTFNVLRDVSSAGGYAVKGYLVNNISAF